MIPFPSPTLTPAAPTSAAADWCIRDWVRLHRSEVPLAVGRESHRILRWTGKHWVAGPDGERWLSQAVQALASVIVFTRETKTGDIIEQPVFLATGHQEQIARALAKNELVDVHIDKGITESRHTAFRNGTLFVSPNGQWEFFEGEWKREWYSPRYHDFDFDASWLTAPLPSLLARLDAAAPAARTYLEQITHSHTETEAQEKMAILLDFLGGFSVGLARKKCAIHLVGERDCGKSTFVLLARGLAPEGSSAVFEPHEIADPEVITQLHGASLWSATETSDRAIPTSTWKAITAHEPVRSRTLYRGSGLSAFSGGIIFAGNEQLRMQASEDSDAAQDRVVRVPILRDPTIIEDPQLIAKLELHKCEIIHFALAYALHYRHEGWDPKQTQIHAATKQAAKQTGNVAEWFLGHYEPSAAADPIPVQALYETYRDSLDRQKSYQAFCKDLKAFATVEKVTARGPHRLKFCVFGYAPVAAGFTVFEGGAA